jgi:hypothetical protein
MFQVPLLRDASSQGGLVNEMARPRDGSSKGRLVQGTARPRDGSSKGRLFQGMARPMDGSSKGWFVQGTRHPRRFIRGRGQNNIPPFSSTAGSFQIWKGDLSLGFFFLISPLKKSPAVLEDSKRCNKKFNKIF